MKGNAGTESKDFNLHKRALIKAAKQLRYDEDILQRLYDAKNEAELGRAMASGRERMKGR